MITVQKYATFKELKAGGEKTADPKKVKERHAEFEKVIKNIYAEIVKKKP